MTDQKSELWANLDEIDANWRQLRETLESLKTTSEGKDPSFIPDSFVDLKHNTFFDSLDQSRNKSDR
mgnify:CR=1 FL=1